MGGVEFQFALFYTAYRVRVNKLKKWNGKGKQGRVTYLDLISQIHVAFHAMLAPCFFFENREHWKKGKE